MEVRKGYKQTDIGVIPEDWEAIKLGSYVEIKSGESPSLFQFESDGIPYFKVDQLNSTNKYLSETPYNVKSGKKIARGSLIFPKRGASILLNKIRILAEDAFMDTNLMTLTPKEKIFSEFLFYALTHVELWRIADTTSIPQINNKHITPLVIALPPTLAEQEAIAEALSDADAQIESLEALLAKKRHVKQGAMSELLKPNRNWVEKKLGQTAVLKARIGWQGLTTKEYLDSGDYFLITGTEFSNGYIDWESCHYVNESRYKQDRNIQVRQHDVLVTKDGTIGKVALITDLPKPATLNSGVFVIRPIEESFVPEFFYYLLCSSLFTEFLGQLSAGSTINHLYQKDFVNFVYKTPPTLEEQTVIAEILSDMDAEIRAVEGKLSKARAIKAGMMSALLSGRIRLVVESGEWRVENE
jgi:type I restriction enzyme S subunit